MSLRGNHDDVGPGSNLDRREYHARWSTVGQAGRGQSWNVSLSGTEVPPAVLRMLAGSLARRSGHLTARTVQIPELLVQAGRSGWPWLCARSGEKSTATGRVSRAAVLPASPTAGEVVHGFLLVN